VVGRAFRRGNGSAVLGLVGTGFVQNFTWHRGCLLAS
jgi:hypothetical protein